MKSPTTSPTKAPSRSPTSVPSEPPSLTPTPSPTLIPTQAVEIVVRGELELTGVTLEEYNGDVELQNKVVDSIAEAADVATSDVTTALSTEPAGNGPFRLLLQSVLSISYEVAVSSVEVGEEVSARIVENGSAFDELLEYIRQHFSEDAGISVDRPTTIEIVNMPESESDSGGFELPFDPIIGVGIVVGAIVLVGGLFLVKMYRARSLHKLHQRQLPTSTPRDPQPQIFDEF